MADDQWSLIFRRRKISVHIPFRALKEILKSWAESSENGILKRSLMYALPTCRLLAEFPNLQDEKSEANSNPLNARMESFARITQAAIDAGDSGALTRQFMLADRFFSHASRELKKAFYISYFDNLNFSRPHGQQARSLMSPALLMRVQIGKHKGAVRRIWQGIGAIGLVFLLFGPQYEGNRAQQFISMFAFKHGYDLSVLIQVIGLGTPAMFWVLVIGGIIIIIQNIRAAITNPGRVHS